MTDAQIHCCLCNHSRSKPVPFIDPDSGRRVVKSSGYHWRLCMNCGNAFPTQIVSLAEMQEYWNRNRVLSNVKNEEEIWNIRYRQGDIWAKRTWEILQNHTQKKSGRFLDIACGLGATVKFFQDHGWQSEGLDADPNTASMHKKLGINVTIGQIEQFNYQDRFDVILIAHAFYFITEPLDFIRRVKSMLNENGTFIVLLSNLLSAHSGSGPSYVHTCFPTPESLAFTLQHEGFERCEILCMKGSTYVVAHAAHAEKKLQKNVSGFSLLRTYLMHVTHSCRHKLFGRPRQIIVNFVKKLLKKL